LAKQGMPLHPSKHENVSLWMKFQITLINTQITILINQPNVSHESNAKLTDNIERKASIGLLCFAWVFQSNKQRLEELCGTDAEGNEIICLVMNQRCIKILIRCILE
jgi:hypothetical protein